MKKTIISFLSMLLLITYSTATYSNQPNDPATASSSKATITGKVIDKNTGESLAGALVEIKGTNIKVYTDLEGNYSISNIDPGVYSLEINFISYSSKTENLTLVANHKESVVVKIQPN